MFGLDGVLYVQHPGYSVPLEELKQCLLYVVLRNP